MTKLKTRVNLNFVGLKALAYERALEKQIEYFNKEFGDYEVNLDLLDYPELYEEMITNKGVLSDEYDVFLTLTEWVPELVKMEALTPLNHFVAENPPEGWPTAWTESLLRLQRDDDEGNFYGFPYDDGPIMLFYRKDLINDPREQEAFKAKYDYSLKVPETWSEFLDVAKFFTRPAKGLYGTALAARPDGHDNVHGFLIQLWSRGGRLLDEDMNPVFNGSEGTEGLQFYVDLIKKYKVAPKESVTFDSTNVGEFYSQGRVFMAVDWTNVGSLAELPGLSKVRGKTGSTLVPRGEGPRGQHVSLNIYWFLSIPRNSKNKAHAYQFLRFMASAAMDKITSLEGANGCRLSTWKDPEILQRFPFYATIEKVQQNVEITPRIPEYPKISEALNKAMAEALDGTKSSKEALDAAAIEVRKILKEAGYYG